MNRQFTFFCAPIFASLMFKIWVLLILEYKSLKLTADQSEGRVAPNHWTYQLTQRPMQLNIFTGYS